MFAYVVECEKHLSEGNVDGVVRRKDTPVYFVDTYVRVHADVPFDALFLLRVDRTQTARNRAIIRKHRAHFHTRESEGSERDTERLAKILNGNLLMEKRKLLRIAIAKQYDGKR